MIKKLAIKENKRGLECKYRVNRKRKNWKKEKEKKMIPEWRKT